MERLVDDHIVEHVERSSASRQLNEARRSTSRASERALVADLDAP
jgi:hypothetical protein